MKTLSLLVLIFSTTFTLAKSLNIANGDWQFKLHISSDYNIDIKSNITEGILTFSNGKERIKLEPFREIGDSLVANFSLYHSSIIITQVKKKRIKGYWRNYNRKGNYKINFTATKKLKKQKGSKDRFKKISGKWETTIQYDKPTSLIGEFKQVENCLHGTFLSETGDYRYLAGNIIKDSLYLSCFDGTHCYLFTGKLFENDSISGHFYSGNHYQTKWTAIKNAKASLRNPDSLTFKTNNKEIEFSLLSTDKKYISYDSIARNGKPTIIQIFGSWCPNCVDETNFLSGLNKKYGADINIVGIGFEMGNTETEKINHLINYKKKMNIHYPILLGGSASKQEAAKLFPMLNHIMSFPTLIVLNQQGDIVKIHTGFNGPATGQHYTNFQNSIKHLLEDLIVVSN